MTKSPTIIAIVFLLLSLRGYAQNKDSTMSLWRNLNMSEFFTRYSPIDYLRVLQEDFKEKQEINVFPMTTSPDNWIREEHIESLMRLIYSADSTKSIMNVVSSHLPSDKYSSVGREAQNLINCFRTKKRYPDFLNSFGAPGKFRGRELEIRWKNYKMWKP